MSYENKSLEEFFIEHLPSDDGPLFRILQAVCFSARITNDAITRAGMTGVLGAAETTNIQGEQQQKLDVLTNEYFLRSLSGHDVVCGIVSEENDHYIEVKNPNQGKSHLIMLDPLDGSSNIDVNAPIGTIFSVYKRKSDPNGPVTLEDFLQKGSEQSMAGYIVYGPSTMLVFTVGNGVYGFTLNPLTGIFHLTHPNIKFPDKSKIYSINESNSGSFSKGLTQYVDWCKEQGHTARYIGSLVIDFHRNLLKGGIYAYPGTSKAPNGKLRLLYECNPTAFIAKQAGGYATDGHTDILDLEVVDIHQKTPFYCGSKDMMDKLKQYLEN